MATKKDIEIQTANMRKLGWSEEEIADVLKADAEIDHGGKLFELDEEHEKVSKVARSAGTRKAPTVYKLDNTDGKRSRKPNALKGEIMQKLYDFLANDSDFADLTMPNAERMLAFSVNELNFELTLIQKRK